MTQEVQRTHAQDGPRTSSAGAPVPRFAVRGVQA
jgi:hypothetical protein